MGIIKSLFDGSDLVFERRLCKLQQNNGKSNFFMFEYKMNFV